MLPKKEYRLSEAYKAYKSATIQKIILRIAGTGSQDIKN
jgi:hypothetical protein